MRPVCVRCKRRERREGKTLCVQCSPGHPPNKVCSGCKKPWTKVQRSSQPGRCKTCVTSERTARRRGYVRQGRCYNCAGRKADRGILCRLCRGKLYERRKRQRLDEKKAAFAAYGGEVCACCGERHFEFLTIDHINGGGAAHRRSLKAAGDLWGIYRWLKVHSYPTGFRVLCMNCNWSIGVHGYCPHSATMSTPKLEEEHTWQAR